MTLNESLVNLINARFQIPGDVIMSRLQKIKENANDDVKRLREDYPNWHIQNDARLTYFYKMINLCERTQFGLHILYKMLDDEWWSQNIENETQLDNGYRFNLVAEYERLYKFDLGLTQFTQIESHLRIYLRSIDSSACKNATSPFDSIYNCLLGKEQLNFSKRRRKAVTTFLDLSRLLRNLIHNNGVYYDYEGEKTTIPYRNFPYEFKNGIPVDFVTWDLLLNLAEDIRHFMKEVIRHEKIAGQNEISDPFWAN